jgi:casein kinase II subunit beta
VEKLKKFEFGRCPRVLCEGQALLPMGQHDIPNQSSVKLYCARCEDIYNPKSSRHAAIDGAYFGTSFHNVLFQMFPIYMPLKSAKRHDPRVFGFKVHAAAALTRWQDVKREDMLERLKNAGVETAGTIGGGAGVVFVEDREHVAAVEHDLDDGSEHID